MSFISRLRRSRQHRVSILSAYLVHPFPLRGTSPQGETRALRDLLSVPYGMIGILLIGSLRSPPPIRLRRTSPAVRSVNRKEGPFMGRLRAYFDRLAHPMQDVHRGRIKHLEASLRKRLYSKHGLLCHLEEGQRWWRQPPKGGISFAHQGGWPVFRRPPGRL